MQIPEFDFDPRTRVVFGPGVLSRLGEFTRELGGRQVLLVTDKGLKDAGHADNALQQLHQAGMNVEIFDEVHPNPTTREIEAGAEFARHRQIEVIVGLGGGSSLDCAKGINFLVTNGGRMQDYRGMGKARLPLLPLIAVPTTAGTGSEAQSYAVIADEVTHMKMACGDKKAAARVALLDPVLTLTMPRSVTGATGIDAISHALETFVTRRRNPVSHLFSRQAWQLLSRSFTRVLDHPQDLAARGDMQLGANLAGAAIENSMLGATHALANPLSAHFDMVHGVAIGVLLPHVIRFNGEDPETAQLYGILAADAGLCSADDPQAPEHLASFVASLVEAAQQPVSMSECGVESDGLSRLAEEAAEQWTGQFNPRPVDQAILLDLYQRAL